MSSFFIGEGYTVEDFGRSEGPSGFVRMLRIERNVKGGCAACVKRGNVPDYDHGLHESWVTLPADASTKEVEAKLAEHKAAIERHLAGEDA